MRKQGKLANWNDDRGFGFIQPADGSRQVFVHVKAFPRGTRRPTIGDSISYDDARDTQGRPRAENARFVEAGASLGSTGKAVATATCFLAAVAGMVATGMFPQQVLWLYCGMSAVTYVVYAWDKAAAQNGRRRTPENTLHLLALAGGWPGALVAQQRERHKSGKQSFRSIFWITVAINVAALIVLALGPGTAALGSFKALQP